MRTVYACFAATICILFAYASVRGWVIVDSIAASHWAPQGHSMYHK